MGGRQREGKSANDRVWGVSHAEKYPFPKQRRARAMPGHLMQGARTVGQEVCLGFSITWNGA